jgi:hypothetical protein
MRAKRLQIGGGAIGAGLAEQELIEGIGDDGAAAGEWPSYGLEASGR